MPFSRRRTGLASGRHGRMLGLDETRQPDALRRPRRDPRLRARARGLHDHSLLHGDWRHCGRLMSRSARRTTPGRRARTSSRWTWTGRTRPARLETPPSPPSDNIAGDCGLQSSITMALVPAGDVPAAGLRTRGRDPRPSARRRRARPSPGATSSRSPCRACRSTVTMNLTRDGKSLLSDTLTPQAKTTEPNGVGCGTCTNASATASTTAM